MRLFYGPEYVLAAAEFDTTRKAAWVAESLLERPVHGVELVAPAPLAAEDITPGARQNMGVASVLHNSHIILMPSAPTGCRR